MNAAQVYDYYTGFRVWRKALNRSDTYEKECLGEDTLFGCGQQMALFQMEFAMAVAILVA